MSKIKFGSKSSAASSGVGPGPGRSPRVRRGSSARHKSVSAIKRRTAQWDQWAHLAQQGDRVAMEELVFAFETTVFRICFRILRDGNLAEDARQETFLQMVKSIHRYDPHFRFSTWLFGVATNVALQTCYSKRRQEKNCVSNGEVNQVAESSDAEVDPLGYCIQREDLGLVQQAMALISPRQRALMTLRFQEGLSPAEIAQILKLPPNRVRVSLWRAREALQQAMRQQRQHLERIDPDTNAEDGSAGRRSKP